MTSLLWMPPVLLATAAAPPVPPPPGAMNVLFIAVDDLRAQFGRAFADEEVLTPRMDGFFLDGGGSAMQRSFVNIAGRRVGTLLLSSGVLLPPWHCPSTALLPKCHPSYTRWCGPYPRSLRPKPGVDAHRAAA